MALKTIRLELARTKDHPEGDANCGYEFKAPLNQDGHLDNKDWKTQAPLCTVRRFWRDEDDEQGLLMHERGRWFFSYEIGESDDEPIFKFDRHSFKVGDYVSITEHDGVTRPFRVVIVR